jgi:uncharacterized LabA/DUF88 family protein
MSRAIVYIDGFNLYFGLKSKQWHRYYWLDLHRMAQNILRHDQRLVAIKYFTARISAHPNYPEKQKRQAIFLDAVETLPDTHLYYGHYLRKQIRCGQCDNVWDSPEEKMTDVNISVEMMKDAFDDAFDVAFLISGDSDLAAPIKTIRERYPKKRIIVVFPPNRHSKRLQSLATGYMRLGEDILRKSKLPDTYSRPDGVVLHRPEKWK